VLLLGRRKLLVIATRGTAAVEPLKELLQISHGEGELGDLLARQCKAR
jgi:hypothetical protein